MPPLLPEGGSGLEDRFHESCTAVAGSATGGGRETHRAVLVHGDRPINDWTPGVRGRDGKRGGAPMVRPRVPNRGGRVLGAGTTAEIRRLGGARTESVNLRGRTVLPGINDSHLHALQWGFSQPPFNVDVSYPAVRSIADIAEAVRTAAAARPPGEWIQGRGWDQPYFAEGRAPTRQDLDRVAPDHPVVLTEFSGHAVWANSKALALALVTRETVPPPDGVIVKDSEGEPTGVLNPRTPPSRRPLRPRRRHLQDRSRRHRNHEG